MWVLDGGADTISVVVVPPLSKRKSLRQSVSELSRLVVAVSGLWLPESSMLRDSLELLPALPGLPPALAPSDSLDVFLVWSAVTLITVGDALLAFCAAAFRLNATGLLLAPVRSSLALRGLAETPVPLAPPSAAEVLLADSDRSL
jgi:hypothetical protein